MEESLDKILQHQRLTYEMMAVLFGEDPILEDENGMKSFGLSSRNPVMF